MKKELIFITSSTASSKLSFKKSQPFFTATIKFKKPRAVELNFKLFYPLSEFPLIGKMSVEFLLVGKFQVCYRLSHPTNGYLDLLQPYVVTQRPAFPQSCSGAGENDALMLPAGLCTKIAKLLDDEELCSDRDLPDGVWHRDSLDFQFFIHRWRNL